MRNIQQDTPPPPSPSCVLLHAEMCSLPRQYVFFYRCVWLCFGGRREGAGGGGGLLSVSSRCFVHGFLFPVLVASRLTLGAYFFCLLSMSCLRARPLLVAVHYARAVRFRFVICFVSFLLYFFPCFLFFVSRGLATLVVFPCLLV